MKEPTAIKKTPIINKRIFKNVNKFLQIIPNTVFLFLSLHLFVNPSFFLEAICSSFNPTLTLGSNLTIGFPFFKKTFLNSLVFSKSE